MSKQWVMILALAILLGMGMIWLLDYSMPGGDEQENTLVLPVMAEQINDISALDIVAPGGAVAVSLRRVNSSAEPEGSALRWRIVQRDGYEADFARVFELLRDLAELQQTEARTSNPDWYARLGVQAVGETDATGRRLDFPLNEVSSLIIGQVDPTGQGSYVRVHQQPQSWLADRVIEVPIDPVQWLEPGIMDIPASDIAQVIVRHADGETVQIRNAGNEQNDFVLLDVPEGRTAGPALQRTALANGLRGQNLEDVRAFNGEIPDSAVRVLFTTHDGLNFVASVFAPSTVIEDGAANQAIDPDSGYWIHFSVSAETAAEDPDSTMAGSHDADDALPDKQTPASDQQADNQRLVNAVAVDARLSPWLFRIPQRRFDDITPRLENLLEPLPQPDAEE